ncbi:VOC family protein [Luteimicrobium sp. DT211]|uniref:VOC family protein n=1 Tax=Luteimicrobium sp. DT211 TaxID=3393412 RepID=UPI003CEF85E3
MQTSTLHPNLTVTDARAAIDFYVGALGAEVVDEITAGDAIIHSDLSLGGSTFTVAAAFPGSSAAPDASAPSSVSFTVNLPSADDVDTTFARAVAAGASAVAEPADWFEGFRQSELRCPFGHRWFLVHVAPQITAADVQRASDAWMATEAG